MTARTTGRARLGRIAAYFVLAAATFSALFPLFWIFLMSIKKPVDIIATPPKFFFAPTLQNYANVLSRPDFLLPVR